MNRKSHWPIGLAACLVMVTNAAAAPLGTLTEFAANGNPVGIAAGPDGNLWFTESTGDRIGQITLGGTITEFSAGITAGSQPRAITTGPDGNLWFTEFAGDRIGRITPTGTVTEFPLAAGSQPSAITTGPDGNLWFTEAGGNRVGQITPDGTITEFSTGITAGSQPGGIAVGPDDNLWFTETAGNRIARITPKGTVTEFGNGITAGSQPTGIAAGPDGNLWFTEFAGNRIGRIDPTGQVTEFSTGVFPGSQPNGIAAGPDGNLWFTEYNQASGGRIARISPSGTVTPFDIVRGSQPNGIATGADGSLWFAEEAANDIGRFGTGVSEPSLRPPSVTGGREAGIEQVCQGDRWATWAGEQPVLDAFGFDGYVWLLDGAPIAGETSTSYTPATDDIGHQLSCTSTVTYPLLAVTASATSTAGPVIAQGATPPPPVGSPPGGGSGGSSGGGGATGGGGGGAEGGLVGAEGPAIGNVRLVTCRKALVGGRRVTRCKTRVLRTRISFGARDRGARGALVRNGIVYAHGVVRRGLLVLHAPRGVRRGRYHLIIRGRYRTIRRTVTIR